MRPFITLARKSENNAVVDTLTQIQPLALLPCAFLYLPRCPRGSALLLLHRTAFRAARETPLRGPACEELTVIVAFLLVCYQPRPPTAAFALPPPTHKKKHTQREGAAAATAEKLAAGQPADKQARKSLTARHPCCRSSRQRHRQGPAPALQVNNPPVPPRRTATMSSAHPQPR